MMDETHHPIQEALPAYALNALEEAEIRTIADHLESCTECNTILVEVQTVLGVLPYSLPADSLDPNMKRRLLAAAQRERRPSPLPATPPSAPSFWENLMAALRPLRWGLVAVAFLLLLGWNLYLQQQLGVLGNSLARMDLARVPTEAVIPLAGTGHPTATARLYLAENLTDGVLAVRGLPELPTNRVYQVWFATPHDTTRSGGVFMVNDLGEAVVGVTVPYPLEGISEIAITEEPAPHSQSPTGTHLLDAVAIEN